MLVLATSTGGVGRHVAAVARGLPRHDVQVAVLGPRATNEKFQFDAPFRAVEIGARLRTLDVLKTLGGAWRVRRFARGANVVHAHGFRAALVTTLALGRLRAPRGRRRPAFVVTFHNAMSGGGFRRHVLERVMRWLASVADAVFVVSPDLASSIENSQRALVAAPVSAPTRDVAEVSRSLDIPDSAAVVLAVGRLHPQKGFDLLIRAASLLASRRDVVVVIAGDGPQRAELSALIDALHVDVRLIGDREDVADLRQVADVAVMPSRWEGWPLAAGEALAAGCPLVVTAVGGLPELVGDAAMVVPPDDVSALADAIAAQLDDAELAGEYRLRAGKRALELPTDDDVTKQLVGCYRGLGSAS